MRYFILSSHNFKQINICQSRPELLAGEAPAAELTPAAELLAGQPPAAELAPAAELIRSAAELIRSAAELLAGQPPAAELIWRVNSHPRS